MQNGQTYDVTAFEVSKFCGVPTKGMGAAASSGGNDNLLVALRDGYEVSISKSFISGPMRCLIY